MRQLSVGMRLQDVRVMNKYTQQQIGEYLGVDQSLISKIEKDQRKINMTQFDKLCLLYNVTPEYLLGETDEYTPVRYRSDEKVDLNAIAKMNQVRGYLKLLRKCVIFTIFQSQPSAIEEMFTGGL